MIRWDLTPQEEKDLKHTLSLEVERLGHILSAKPDSPAGNRKLTIERLLKSLAKAEEATQQFDLLCYCDTNYDFHGKMMAISYRIGDEEAVHHEQVTVLKPPPDEYIGIIMVLQALEQSDAARCTLALQMRMQYKVPNHSENQSPRSSNFGESHDAAIALTRQLLTRGCRVEFTHKHRSFINEALKIR